MDHRAFLSTLSGEARRRLTETSDRAGFLHLSAHLGAIVVLGGLVASNVPGWPLLMLPLGILLVFLFTLLHETSHATAFRSPMLNRAAGQFAAFVLFLPATWFRFFHLAHHRHTQVPGKDPELASPPPETVWAYLVHISGLPVWKGHLAALVRCASGRVDDDFVPAARRPALVREARLMLLGYAALAAASIAAGSTVLVFVWLVPLLLGQPFLRAYLLAEHGRCPFVANMFENTRTTFTNRLVRFLAWNMPFHAEHHAVPTVPFHRLPELHAMIRPHLRATADGYAAFNRDYVAAIRGADAAPDRLAV
jgi:fatty acid desaturase